MSDRRTWKPDAPLDPPNAGTGTEPVGGGDPYGGDAAREHGHGEPVADAGDHRVDRRPGRRSTP